jgi:hypothetical protein
MQEQNKELEKEEQQNERKRKDEARNIVWALPTLTMEEKFRSITFLRSVESVDEFLSTPVDVREDWIRYNI